MRFKGMDAHDSKAAVAAVDRQRARGFRIAGAVLMLAGLVAAGGVWWWGTRSAGAADSGFDGDSKTQVRQVETMYGQQGLLLQNLTDNLKQPGAQAGVILAVTGLLTAGCFYVAYLSAGADE